MPELPEVNRRFAATAGRIVGRTIQRVRVLRSSVLLDSPRKLRRTLIDETITGVRRWEGAGRGDGGRTVAADLPVDDRAGDHLRRGLRERLPARALRA